jgi:hypothetical protein
MLALASAIGAVAIAGCGSAGGSSEAVVDMNGAKLTKATVEHWVSIAAARDYELMPSKPIPRWVIPDPPKFTECIAHLPALLGQGAKPPQTLGGRKAQCESRYQALRDQVLSGLISGEWFIAEGKRKGLRATEAEVTHRVERVRTSAFGNEAAFKRYLSYTGETFADQMFRSRIKVYSEKILQEIVAKPDRVQAMHEFSQGFPRRWVAKTSCSPGYVVPGCKQYRGSVIPEAGSL